MTTPSVIKNVSVFISLLFIYIDSGCDDLHVIYGRSPDGKEKKKLMMSDDICEFWCTQMAVFSLFLASMDY